MNSDIQRDYLNRKVVLANNNPPVVPIAEGFTALMCDPDEAVQEGEQALGSYNIYVLTANNDFLNESFSRWQQSMYDIGLRVYGEGTIRWIETTEKDIGRDYLVAVWTPKG